MFLYSLIEQLSTKEENSTTGRNFNFGHECTYIIENMLCKELIYDRYINYNFKYKIERRNINENYLRFNLMDK